MKTDKAKVQQIVDDVEEALEEVERTTDGANRAVKVLHRQLTKAGKLLSDEADGQIVTKATGEGK